jgi:transcriptional antiterminator RfaH
MTDWYLVYCKPRQEDAAAGCLEEQGYCVYLPKLKGRRRRAQGMVDVVQPLFPRYLFVAPGDEEQSITPVKYTAGVSKLVRFAIDYVPVPAGVVDALRACEDPDTGFHRLVAPNMKPGEPVRIQTGAFAGIDAIFEAQSGRDRIIVLMELLGQKVRAEVAIGELDL